MKTKHCLNCGDSFLGRSDKKFCCIYCKSNFHYEAKKENPQSLFKKIDKQLKLNRKLLQHYNQAGKSTIRKQKLLDAGFEPKYFTHYWKNKKGQVYLFCYEFGFLAATEYAKEKYVLVTWQKYMEG